ncbi:hypothetical protein BP00DRAFT_41147 [Aspergillus indologenus CBS 114.80]|uniref:Uncharacterized protein n=1 Tax=Aspergillus indologenus CBS 114.80 TaxID=1450541 RepID=A0A2V5J8V2_9EURO|nr:hypothetical protein BP00DRAFT_41147 [Aspergillus indologenus CBS 114.80]
MRYPSHDCSCVCIGREAAIMQRFIARYDRGGSLSVPDLTAQSIQLCLPSSQLRRNTRVPSSGSGNGSLYSAALIVYGVTWYSVHSTDNVVQELH